MTINYNRLVFFREYTYIVHTVRKLTDNPQLFITLLLYSSFNVLWYTDSSVEKNRKLYTVYDSLHAHLKPDESLLIRSSTCIMCNFGRFFYRFVVLRYRMSRFPLSRPYHFEPRVKLIIPQLCFLSIFDDSNKSLFNRYFI